MIVIFIYKLMRLSAIKFSPIHGSRRDVQATDRILVGADDGFMTWGAGVADLQIARREKKPAGSPAGEVNLGDKLDGRILPEGNDGPMTVVDFT